jgi:hypothetical protein
MRALTPIGPFRETGEEEYAHTPFSEIYMVPQMSAIFKVLYVRTLLLPSEQILRLTGSMSTARPCSATTNSSPSTTGKTP